MDILQIIENKALGQALTADEIAFAVNGFVAGEVKDYQMSSLMMAIRLMGMTRAECAELTMSMLHSGDVIDLSDLPGVKVDKHSTGGVGDTTTLVLAPLVAACGGTVAKMSGRGLFFTGGTLDKLESIPGTRVDQPPARFHEIVQKIGIAIVGQTGDLVPADKKMYALRDVTGTVQSLPLIAASIMSKKLAAGADAIVLDVKMGTGAFVKNLDDARELAAMMAESARAFGRRVVVCITDMNQPLGLAVGNALEMREAVELLSGKMAKSDPLYRVCMLLGAQMLRLSELAADDAQAQQMLTRALEEGRGLQKLRDMIAELGGDASYLSVERMDALCAVRRLVPLYPERDGYLIGMTAAEIGKAAQLLGAGRETLEDRIDPAVGLVMHCRIGDRVRTDEPFCTLHVNDERNLAEAERMLRNAVQIGDAPQQTPPLIYDVIG